MLNLTTPVCALILGGRGGVGGALAAHLLEHDPRARVIITSRAPAFELTNSEQLHHERALMLPLDITEEGSWARFLPELKAQLEVWGVSLNVMLNATGLLHNERVSPERALRQLELSAMREVFEVNTFGVALALKHLTPLLPRRERSIFASLSAKVGSISDNRLGGWHSYRASKAAQHMLIKNAALELARTHPACVCVALHPGTVATALSEPFRGRVQHEVFSPEQSAAYLLAVLERLTPSDSGGCFGWDGALILP